MNITRRRLAKLLGGGLTALFGGAVLAKSSLPDGNVLQAMGKTILVAGQKATDPPLLEVSDADRIRIWESFFKAMYRDRPH